MNKSKYHSIIISLLFGIILAGPSFAYNLRGATVRSQDLLLLVLAVYVFLLMKQLRLYRYLTYAVIPLMSIFVYAVIFSIWTRTWNADVLIELIDLIRVIISFFLVSTILYFGDSSKIIKYTLLTVFTITVIGSVHPIIDYATIGERTFGISFAFGLVSVSIYYSIWRYLEYRSYLSLAGFVILLIRVLIGQGRMMWILLPLAGLVALIISNQNLRSNMGRREIKLLSVILSLAALFLLFSPQIQSRLLSVFKGTQFLFARPVVYLTGILIFFSNPLGFGLGTFSRTVQSELNQNEITYPDWFVDLVGQRLINHVSGKMANGITGPHSDIIQMMVELGIVGVLLYSLYLFGVLKIILRDSSADLSPVLKSSIILIIGTSVLNPGILSGNGIIHAIVLSMYVAVAADYPVIEEN